MMNKYEMVYVIDTAIEEEARKAVIENTNAMVVELGGTVDKVEEWGKRHMAYAVNDKTEGYYVLVNYTADATAPKEIERKLQIADEILRYLTVKTEDKRSNVKPRAVRVAPAAEAAPAEEAAPAVETAEQAE